MDMVEFQKAVAIVRRAQKEDNLLLDRSALTLVLRAFDWCHGLAIEYAVSKQRALTSTKIVPEGTKYLTAEGEVL